RQRAPRANEAACVRRHHAVIAAGLRGCAPRPRRSRRRPSWCPAARPWRPTPFRHQGAAACLSWSRARPIHNGRINPRSPTSTTEARRGPVVDVLMLVVVVVDDVLVVDDCVVEVVVDVLMVAVVVGALVVSVVVDA